MSHSDNVHQLGREDIQRRMVTGFAWQGFTKGIVQTSSWIATIFVARILSPEDYGIMAVCGVFTMFAYHVSQMGLAQGLITAPSSDTDTEEAIFSMGIALAAFVYSILYILAPTIARLYEIPDMENVIRVGGLAIFLGVSKSVPYALAMRSLNFRYRSLVEMAAQFVQIVTLISLAVLGYRYWSLVWAFMAKQLVAAVAYWPLYSRVPRFRLLNAQGIQVAKFGVKVTLNRLAFFILQSSPTAIIGKLLGSSLLGYYNMAFQLAVMPIDKIANVFNQVIFPAIARVDPDKAEDARYVFLRTHRYMLLLLQPALVGLALVAPDLIPVLLTEKWNPVIPVLQVFCVLNILRLSSMMFPPVLSGRNKPELVLITTMVGLLILPVSVYVGAEFGLAGVMVAWIVVQPILFAVSLRFLMRLVDLRFNEFAASWIPASSGSLALIACVSLGNFWMQDFDPIVRLVVSIVVGVASYLATIVIFHRRDVRNVRRVLRSVLNRSNSRD